MDQKLFIKVMGQALHCQRIIFVGSHNCATYFGILTALVSMTRGIDKWLRRRAPVLEVRGLNPAEIWLKITAPC